MRFSLIVALLIACKGDDRRAPTALEAKEQAVAAARKAADEAKQAMHAAEGRAAEAWKRLEAARAEHAKARDENAQIKDRLAAVRKEAAETIELAEQKLVELRSAVKAHADKIEDGGGNTAKLGREKAELEATIAKIENMKAELEASSR